MSATQSRPMPSPLRYDIKLWVASRGKEHLFRDRQLELAGIAPGDRVLDIGCGTGTLAIAAAKRVGRDGSVHGVDPSIALLARAERKAHRAGVDVQFHTATGERLPFDDASFDVVTSTLVFHHLAGTAVHATFAEIRRVLRADGRLLVVDIGGEQDAGQHTMHGPGVSFDLDTFVPKLGHVGFKPLDSGPIDSGMRSLERLRYFVATPA